MTREEKVLQLIDRNGIGLEIGPSYNPIAPKSQGWNVETVDHLDADGLRKKYQALGVDVSKVEDVDHIITDKSIAETVAKPAHFDFVMASHLIEHTPDMITFLQDCQSLLKPGGILSLVVPDKRYCFDIYQPLTSTGMVFQAFLKKRKRVPPGTIFDSLANHVIRGSDIIWFERNPADLQLCHSIVESQTITEDYIRSSEYRDAHVWKFTPSSFLLIIQDIIEMKLTELGIASFHSTYGFEFFVSLKKGPVESTARPRIDLLRAINEELYGPTT